MPHRTAFLATDPVAMVRFRLPFDLDFLGRFVLVPCSELLSSIGGYQLFSRVPWE